MVELLKDSKTLKKIKMEIMRRYHTDKHEAALKERGMVKAREIQTVLNDICTNAAKIY